MDVKQFDFEGKGVRSVVLEGAIWFVAADACRALDLSPHKGSYSAHTDKLDPDEKRAVGRQALLDRTPGLNPGVVSEGLARFMNAKCVDAADPVLIDRAASAWLISESGLYTLILRSREATTPGTLPHRFRRWVTAEVLPAIRKTGGYGEARAAVNLRDPAQMLQVATQLAELLHEREGEVAALRPQAEAFQRIADGSASMTITEAAKTLQIPPRQLGIALRDRGWLYRRAPGKGWLAYQSRIEAGHLEHKITELRGEARDPALPGKFVSQVRITAKGVGQLAELLGRAPGRAAGVAAGQAGLPLAPTIAPAA